MRYDPLTQLQKIQPVILCGGSGTRLWPLSRANAPKQFLALTGDRSLIEAAFLRAQGLPGAEPPILVAAARHEGLVRQALRNTAMKAFLILEPQARNTAPAVAAAALHAAACDPETIVLMMPADHLVEGGDEFRQSVAKALDLAAKGWLTVLGVTPQAPSSAVGYILTGDRLSASGSRVERFIEKPAPDRAAELIAAGALWNAGMIVAKAGVIVEALKRYEPALVRSVAASLDAASRNEDGMTPAPEHFAAAKNISFDHAVLERDDRVAVTPLAARWRDLGTWSEVMELHAADAQGNRGMGDIRIVQGKDNFILSPRRSVLALGTDDLVIVDSPDALLVARRGHLPLLGDAVKELPQEIADVTPDVAAMRYPWGDAETIAAGPQSAVRKLAIGPGEATEAADHECDHGHWIVLSGRGTATIGGRAIAVRAGQAVATPAGMTRRIENTGDELLQIIEVGFASGADAVATIREVV